MNPIQIINQAYKNKRTAFRVINRQKRAVLFAFFMLVLFPLLYSCFSYYYRTYTIGENKLSELEVITAFPEAGRYRVKVRTSWGEREMGLESYIACMLPAVIPVEYEEETLKAQAILLRTQLFCLYEQQKEEKTNWEPYYIFVEENERIKTYFTFWEQKHIFGEKYTAYMTKYCHAVSETAGMYIKKDERPAKTAWFRVSAGNTREGVACEKDYQSEDYLSYTTVSSREFLKTMENLPELAGKKIKDVRFTGVEGTSAYTKTLNFEIAAEVSDFMYQEERFEYQISGERFCEVFHLNSPCVQNLETERKKVTITVKGVGHGSGMSQYAANELAKDKKNYTEILNYFFTNIAIDKFE